MTSPDAGGTSAVPDAPAPQQQRRAADVGDGTSKRTLQALSRRIEELAAGWAEAGPVTLVGLFQLSEYYHDSRDIYERLATNGDTTVVVGHVGTAEQETDVDVAELAAGGELADFWTVLLLSRRGCAGLRARDTGQIGPGLSIEAGRLFSARTSTDPTTVAGWLHELLDHRDGGGDARRRGRLLDAADVAGADADRGDAIAARALHDAWTRMASRIEALQRTELLMFTDPLTGALNRRFLDRYLDRLGGRSPDIAVVAIDFDDFKAINDTHGHAIGDEALRLFAQVVGEHVRDSDVLVRTGGDEWMLLLPGMPLSLARERVSSLIADVASRPLSVPGVRVRASAGLGVFAATAIDLAAVDEALYAAKDDDDHVAVVGG